MSLTLVGESYMKRTKRTRGGSTTRYGTFLCSYCSKEVEKRCHNASRNKSCGCLDSRESHGMAGTRIYRIWASMKERCYVKTAVAYKNYGGRGISICPEWKNSFSSFYAWATSAGYNSSLTLDRKDNDGNYCPTNCRWATREVQSRNTRRLRKNNTTGFRGVGKRKNRFMSRICVDNIQIYIGSFKTKLEAAQAYNDYVDEHSLEHTKNILKKEK